MSDAERDQAASPAARGWKRASATFLAILAAGPASVGLVFTLFPDVKPDPGDQLSAVLRPVTIDTRVSLGDFLSDIGARKRLSELAIEDRDDPGAVVYVDVSIKGRKHENLELFHRLHDARTRARVKPPEGESAEPREPASYFHADTPNDRWITPVWMPSRSDVGRVFVRFELYDGRSMLAVADSRSFRFPRQPTPLPDGVG